MDTCRIEGCEKPVSVKKDQLCVTHYHRFKRGTHLDGTRKNARPVCSVDECQMRAVAHGLCDIHYRRQRRYGTTDLPARPDTCIVEGCDKPALTKSMCDQHYRREARGDATTHTHRTCSWCGKTISPAADSRRKYCSRECKEKEHGVRRMESYRTTWLKRYGLTPESFGALLASQYEGCAICGTTEVPKRGSFCVDHDHETGKVRGILCSECNKGLGQFRDDPALLRKAAAYLEDGSHAVMIWSALAPSPA